MTAIPRRKSQQRNAGDVFVLKSVVLSVPGAQTVGAKQQAAFVLPEPGIYVTSVARLGTVNTGSTFIIDVNRNGTTLYTTQARRPTIAAASATGVSTETAQADVTVLAKGDRINVDVDQVGSTIAGTDLSVTVSYMATAAG